MNTKWDKVENFFQLQVKDSSFKDNPWFSQDKRLSGLNSTKLAIKRKNKTNDFIFIFYLSTFDWLQSASEIYNEMKKI